MIAARDSARARSLQPRLLRPRSRGDPPGVAAGAGVSAPRRAGLPSCFRRLTSAGLMIATAWPLGKPAVPIRDTWGCHDCDR
jgi:hypothetical protein